MNDKMTPDEIKELLKEYEYDPDPMNDEDERVLDIKQSMTKLTPAEKIIMCMYLDMGSSRKLGKELGCSHSSILKEIKKIKAKIKANLQGDY